MKLNGNCLVKNSNRGLEYFASTMAFIKLSGFNSFFSAPLFLMMIIILYDEVEGSGEKQNLPTTAFLMPAIIWDPRNPLFDCPSRGINTINVRMLDYLPFGCPAEGKNLNSHNSLNIPYTEMFENAFITEDENAALKCNATGMKLLLKCNTPNTVKFRTVRIAEISGGDDPLFKAGRTYYVLATSTGREIDTDNRIGGRCTGLNGGTSKVYKMILKIKTCSKEDAGTESCPLCLTYSCYNKGCGIYSDWGSPQFYRKIDELYTNNATKNLAPVCKSVKKRVCNNEIYGCNGTDTEENTVKCPSVVASPTYNCSDWKNLTEIYRSTTGSGCYKRSYQTCLVGTLEKYNITQWRMINASCPPAPTQKPCTANWRNVSSILKNSTNHCFRNQERICEYCNRNVTEMKSVPVNCPIIPSPSTSIVSSCYTSTLTTVSTIASSSCLTTRTTVVSISTSIVTSTIVSTYFVERTTSSIAPSPSVTSSSQSLRTTVAVVPVSSSSFTNIDKSTSNIKASESISPTTSKILSTSQTPPCKPGSGKSTGADDSIDAKQYAIPVASAVFGCLCGALAVWYYTSIKQKRIANELYETGSNVTLETDGTGVSNRAYRMSTLKKGYNE